ncbi:MAG: hypothetical protein RLZZ408_1427 [Verrucomicrobiota bacterium]
MSLIEVVIAIGIISFAIIPLVGLLGMGLTSSTSANEDLAEAAIISYMQSDLRSRSPTTNAWTTNSNAAFSILTNSSVSRTNYFDAQGSWVTNGATPTGTNLTRTVYVATFTNATNATNYIDYSILIRWPHPSYGKTNMVPSRLFRYE